jgi:large subunit ribosomal protein L6
LEEFLLDTFTDGVIIGDIEVPEKVTATKEKNVLVIKGTYGIVKKDFTKLPAYIDIEENKIRIKPYGRRKKDLAITNTAKSIISNMIKGVEEGFTYKLKIVFAHFPISVKIKGKEIHVENFFGERSARVSKIIGEDTKVNVSAEDVLVQGPSLEHVSQTAANIESSTKIKNKDQRVFLDGLYIYAREGGLK